MLTISRRVSPCFDENSAASRLLAIGFFSNAGMATSSANLTPAFAARESQLVYLFHVDTQISILAPRCNALEALAKCHQHEGGRRAAYKTTKNVILSLVHLTGCETRQVTSKDLFQIIMLN